MFSQIFNKNDQKLYSNRYIQHIWPQMFTIYILAILVKSCHKIDENDPLGILGICQQPAQGS